MAWKSRRRTKKPNIVSHIKGTSCLTVSPSGALQGGLLLSQTDPGAPEPQRKVLRPGPDADRPPGQEQRSQLCQMCHHVVMKQV